MIKLIKVRVQAAGALSIFCFNCPQNAAAIRDAIGGLTPESIESLFESYNLATRYKSAFHQIILAQIVENSDPAILAANGIKCLIEALEGVRLAQNSYEIELVAAATHHIAALIRLKGTGVVK